MLADSLSIYYIENVVSELFRLRARRGRFGGSEMRCAAPIGGFSIVERSERHAERLRLAGLQLSNVPNGVPNAQLQEQVFAGAKTRLFGVFGTRKLQIT